MRNICKINKSKKDSISPALPLALNVSFSDTALSETQTSQKTKKIWKDWYLVTVPLLENESAV